MAPEAIIIAGPNGAGKSTLAYEYIEVHGYDYLSADLIATTLRPDKPETVRIEAGKRFFDQIGSLIENRKSFIVETTLAGGGFKRVLEKLRQSRYATRIAFVFLDSPVLCVRRVQERVQRGGHDVPIEDIIRRFYRSKRNFWYDYRLQVDRWYLFYNAGEHVQEVAVGEGTDFEVIDERLYALFLKDID